MPEIECSFQRRVDTEERSEALAETALQATAPEVKELQSEAAVLKEVVA